MRITRSIIPFIFLTFFLANGCVQTEAQRKKDSPPPETVVPAEKNILKAVDDLAEDLIATLDMKRPTYRPRIAIVDLLGPGKNHTLLGRFLTEKLTTRFVKLHRFENVLERHLFKELLQQQKLEMAGYFDPDTVKEVAGKTGMQALVTGVITDIGNVLDINARIIDHNGEILSAAEVQIPTTAMAEKILTAKLRILVQPSYSGIQLSDIQVSLDEVTLIASKGVAIFKEIPQGNRSIMISGKDIEGVQRNVYLMDDKSISVPVKVRTADLTVRVTPKDANVILDGISRTPDEQGITVFKSLALGKHSLVVEAPCYETEERKLQLKANERVDIKLGKTCGELNIKVAPKTAEVVLDNVPQTVNQKGIAKIPSVPFGRHSLQISAPGYETMQKFVEVKGDVMLRFSLKRAEGISTGTLGNEYDNLLASLVALDNDSPPFKIHIWTNEQSYRIDDNITFSFKADKNCYLTLIDISTNGELKILFPNCLHKNNYVRAGHTYNIPAQEHGFKFEVGGPAGIERLKAIATLKPLQIFDIDCDSGPFYGLARDNSRAINIVTQKVNELTQEDFADAYLEFRIR